MLKVGKTEKQSYKHTLRDSSEITTSSTVSSVLRQNAAVPLVRKRVIANPIHRRHLLMRKLLEWTFLASDSPKVDCITAHKNQFLAPFICVAPNSYIETDKCYPEVTNDTAIGFPWDMTNYKRTFRFHSATNNSCVWKFGKCPDHRTLSPVKQMLY